MSEATASIDAMARKLSLGLMGEKVERDLAAGIDDAATGRETMASLLSHQIASCHFLALRFFAMANAYLDRAGPGSAGGDGDKAALLAVRLAGMAARLNERCRAATLTRDKLRPQAPRKVPFRLNTGIDRVGPPGYDRHWEKPGYRDDDDDKGGGTTPPAGRAGPGSGTTPPPASRAAGRERPLAGHGVDRPFSRLVPEPWDTMAPLPAILHDARQQHGDCVIGVRPWTGCRSPAGRAPCSR